MSKNKFKITKKILAKEENQVDSRLYEIISKNIQIRTLGDDRNDLFKMLLQLQSQLDQLKQQLAETEQEFLVFQEDSARNEQIYIRELAEKQNTIDKINKEFVQAVHDWKALCAEKDKEIERLKNLFELNGEKDE